LAGAVGPEQGEDLAGPDGQVHAVQGTDGAVALMDPTQADRGGVGGVSGPGGGGLGGGGVEGGPVIGGRVAWGGGRRDHDIRGPVRAGPIPGAAITAHPWQPSWSLARVLWRGADQTGATVGYGLRPGPGPPGGPADPRWRDHGDRGRAQGRR